MDPPSSTGQWEVGYARFFPLPLRLGPTANGLRPLKRSKQMPKGTWLSSASFAVATVSTRSGSDSSDAGAAVLSVSLGPHVVEEHYMARLCFSWPQVSNASRNPNCGSRAVFVSYCEAHCQVQKFAMLFKEVSAVRSFLNCMKMFKVDKVNFGLPQTNPLPEDSFASDYTGRDKRLRRLPSSHPPHNFAAVTVEPRNVSVREHSLVAEYNAPSTSNCRAEGVASFIKEVPARICLQEKERAPLPPLLSTNNGRAFPGLNELLTTLTNTGVRKSLLDGSETTHLKVGKANPCHGSTSGSDGLTAVAEDIVLSQIESSLDTDTFNEMLRQLERVIYENGGDMALQ